MSTYARIANGIAVEIVNLPAGVTPNEAFVSSIASQFVACPSGVAANWTYSGGTFSAPVAATPSVAQLQSYAKAKASGLLSTMKSYGSSAPILKADRTSGTIADLLAIIADATTAPSDSVTWLANDNSDTVFTAAQIAALAPQVAGDRKAIFGTCAEAMAGIAAATITTFAEIDALSWPA